MVCTCNIRLHALQTPRSERSGASTPRPRKYTGPLIAHARCTTPGAQQRQLHRGHGTLAVRAGTDPVSYITLLGIALRVCVHRGVCRRHAVWGRVRIGAVLALARR